MQLLSSSQIDYYLMAMALQIKTAQSCEYACISLGEVMLRLDPGEGRVHTSRQLTAWEGGG